MNINQSNIKKLNPIETLFLKSKSDYLIIFPSQNQLNICIQRFAKELLIELILITSLYFVDLHIGLDFIQKKNRK